MRCLLLVLLVGCAATQPIPSHLDWPVVAYPLSEKTLDALSGLGHKLVIRSGPLSAAPSVISFDPKTGGMSTAGDPRAGRHAMAY